MTGIRGFSLNAFNYIYICSQIHVALTKLSSDSMLTHSESGLIVMLEVMIIFSLLLRFVCEFIIVM